METYGEWARKNDGEALFEKSIIEIETKREC